MKITNRSGSGTEAGLNSTAFTTEKIAVLVPMPSVSAATAASVKAGLWTNIRSACFRSCNRWSSMAVSKGDESGQGAGNRVELAAPATGGQRDSPRGGDSEANDHLTSGGGRRFG